MGSSSASATEAKVGPSQKGAQKNLLCGSAKLMTVSGSDFASFKKRTNDQLLIAPSPKYCHNKRGTQRVRRTNAKLRTLSTNSGLSMKTETRITRNSMGPSISIKLEPNANNTTRLTIMPWQRATPWNAQEPYRNWLVHFEIITNKTVARISIRFLTSRVPVTCNWDTESRTPVISIAYSFLVRQLIPNRKRACC